MVMNSIDRYRDDFFRDITSLGSAYLLGGLGLIFLVVGQMDVFLKLIFILFSTYIIAALVRMVYFKNRPKKQGYSDFMGKIDASSFPSVHAGRVVSTGLMFNEIFPELLGLIVLVGGLVLYSRIYLKKHDWVDISGGIVLGLIVFWIMGFVI